MVRMNKFTLLDVTYLSIIKNGPMGHATTLYLYATMRLLSPFASRHKSFI